jgi:hypothetical protein
MNELQELEKMCAAVPVPDGERLARARARVLGGVTGATARRAGQGPERRVTRPRVALAGAVTALVAGVTTAVLVIPAGTGGVATGHRAVQLDAALVLHRAAQAALTAPQPGSKPFIYISSGGYSSRNGRWHLQSRVEQWLSVTGQRVGASKSSPCLPLARGCVGLPVPIEPGFTYTGVRKLPTAPSALLDYLYRRHPRPCNINFGPRLNQSGTEWEGINTILTDVPVLPPRFGAALFNAAAHIPGVWVVEHATGPAGQHGIGVTLTMTYPALVRPGVWKQVTEWMELVFNPHTYRYIGNAWGFRHSPWGTRTQATALTSAGFASSAPAHSPGYLWIPGDLCPGVLS